MKRLLSGLLAAAVALCLCAGCAKPPAESTTTTTPPTSTATTVPPTTVPVGYQGTTVILYTANVRGDISVYARIAAAKAAYEAEGATVYLVDAGNYLQGSVYANYDMGATIYQLMEAAGYDVAGMGIYDLAHGEAELGYAPHGNLVKFYPQAQLYRGAKELTYQQNAPWAKVPVNATRPAKAAAAFRVICSNLSKPVGGYYDFDASAVLGQSLKVGFVSVLPENAAEYMGDGFLQGYAYTPVAKPQCDILVSLGGGEGDIVIEAPMGGEMACGAYVIRHSTGQIILEQVDLSASDGQIEELVAALTVPTVIGTSSIILGGSTLAACNGQTEVGKLAADALKWYAENKMEGIAYPVIGLFNGGNCRNFLYDGDITEMEIQNAYHGSTAGVGVIYWTGAQLLEALEAATQRENCPGWAQVSGISYTVDREKAFDFGEAYGLYYKAASINRVSITPEDFDPNTTYAVVADMLLLSGEDTYYVFGQSDIAVRNQATLDLSQIVAMYIQQALGGHIAP